MLAEQVPDVEGYVGEGVTGVLIDALANLLAGEESATIGVDETANEGLRGAVGDVSLPRAERNRAAVLGTWSVLRRRNTPRAWRVMSPSPRYAPSRYAYAG